MKAMHAVSYFLVIIGSLNWLLVGLFGWDIGEIFGGTSAVASRFIYVLVGLAAIFEIATHRSYCKYCEKKASTKGAMGAQQM